MRIIRAITLVVIVVSAAAIFLLTADFGRHEPPTCVAGSAPTTFTNCKH